MYPRDAEMGSGMADVVHLGRIGEDPAFGVAHHRVVLPGPFPQLVEHLEVLVGMVVTCIVRRLIGLAHVACGCRKVAGDDVPAHPAVGQVIQRRHPPGERVGMLESGPGGDSEAQVLGDQRHRRHQQHRVAHRDLRGLADGRFVAGSVHVVGAQHVGDEETVKTPAFQQLRQLGPVGDVLVAPGLVFRVAPQARGLVGDTIHVEGIEADHAGHRAEDSATVAIGHRLCSAGLFWR